MNPKVFDNDTEKYCARCVKHLTEYNLSYSYSTVTSTEQKHKNADALSRRANEGTQLNLPYKLYDQRVATSLEDSKQSVNKIDLRSNFRFLPQEVRKLQEPDAEIAPAFGWIQLGKIPSYKHVKNLSRLCFWRGPFRVEENLQQSTRKILLAWLETRR